MIKNKINRIVDNFNKFKIEGYIIPKNDNFFSEYVKHDRLKIISNFTGSAGFAIIFKNKNYLFVDGRYTLQANSESGKNFKIVEFPNLLPKNLFQKVILGYDPTLFTKLQLQYFFGKKIKLVPISENLVDILKKPSERHSEQYYSLPSKITGKSHKLKISVVSNIIKKNKSDYLFISAPENVSWLLNIRGSDVPFSPIVNCYCLIGKNKKILIIGKKNKFKNLLKKKTISKNQIIDPKNLVDLLEGLKGKNFIIDEKTCSIFYEELIAKKFHIKKRVYPCYLLKSKKN